MRAEAHAVQEINKNLFHTAKKMIQSRAAFTYFLESCPALNSYTIVERSEIYEPLFRFSMAHYGLL